MHNMEPSFNKASKPLAKHIEVEPNVGIHRTDAGEGSPLVLIHASPLSFVNE